MTQPVSGFALQTSHPLHGAILKFPIATTSASPPHAFTPSAAFEARILLLPFLRGLAATMSTRLLEVMYVSNSCGYILVIVSLDLFSLKSAQALRTDQLISLYHDQHHFEV
jgi:hypothetical protein